MLQGLFQQKLMVNPSFPLTYTCAHRKGKEMITLLGTIEEKLVVNPSVLCLHLCPYSCPNLSVLLHPSSEPLVTAVGLRASTGKSEVALLLGPACLQTPHFLKPRRELE